MKNERHVKITAQATIRSIQKQFEDWKLNVINYRHKVREAAKRGLDSPSLLAKHKALEEIMEITREE